MTIFAIFDPPGDLNFWWFLDEISLMTKNHVFFVIFAILPWLCPNLKMANFGHFCDFSGPGQKWPFWVTLGWSSKPSKSMFGSLGTTDGQMAKNDSPENVVLGGSGPSKSPKMPFLPIFDDFGPPFLTIFGHFGSKSMILGSPPGPRTLINHGNPENGRFWPNLADFDHFRPKITIFRDF